MSEQNSHFVRNLLIALLLLAAIAAGVYWYTVWRSNGEESAPPSPPAASDQPGVNNFSVEGNIVRDNSGMEPEIWYLVYDESGAPGRSVKLTFTERSRCKIGDFDGICRDTLIVVGARVRVTGYRADAQVFVHEYAQVDLEEKG